MLDVFDGVRPHRTLHRTHRGCRRVLHLGRGRGLTPVSTLNRIIRLGASARVLLSVSCRRSPRVGVACRATFRHRIARRRGGGMYGPGGGQRRGHPPCRGTRRSCRAPAPAMAVHGHGCIAVAPALLIRLVRLVMARHLVHSGVRRRAPPRNRAAGHPPAGPEGLAPLAIFRAPRWATPASRMDRRAQHGRGCRHQAVEVLGGASDGAGGARPSASPRRTRRGEL